MRAKDLLAMTRSSYAYDGVSQALQNYGHGAAQAMAKAMDAYARLDPLGVVAAQAIECAKAKEQVGLDASRRAVRDALDSLLSPAYDISAVASQAGAQIKAIDSMLTRELAEHASIYKESMSRQLSQHLSSLDQGWLSNSAAATVRAMLKQEMAGLDVLQARDAAAMASTVSRYLADDGYQDSLAWQYLNDTYVNLHDSGNDGAQAETDAGHATDRALDRLCVLVCLVIHTVRFYAAQLPEHTKHYSQLLAGEFVELPWSEVQPLTMLLIRYYREHADDLADVAVDFHEVAQYIDAANEQPLTEEDIDRAEIVLSRFLQVLEQLCAKMRQ